MSECVWRDYDERDAAGNRRVICIHCGYVTRTRTAYPFHMIHGAACGRWKAPRPGTELKKILSLLGATPAGQCNCNEMVAQMNAWGPEGCREHRQEIVQHLRKAYKGLMWGEIIKASSTAITCGLFMKINPLDVCGSLVDLAIAKASQANDS